MTMSSTTKYESGIICVTSVFRIAVRNVQMTSFMQTCTYDIITIHSMIVYTLEHKDLTKLRISNISGDRITLVVYLLDK